MNNNKDQCVDGEEAYDYQLGDTIDISESMMTTDNGKYFVTNSEKGM